MQVTPFQYRSLFIFLGKHSFLVLMKLTYKVYATFYLNSFLPSDGHWLSIFNLIIPISSKVGYFNR